MLTDKPSLLQKKLTARTKVKFIFITLISLFFCLFFTFNYLTTSPTNTSSVSVEVVSGQSVRSIAKTMEERGVVRSELLLYIALTYWHDPTMIFAGTYLFNGDESLKEVAAKLAESDIENNLIKITLPEGLRVNQMAQIAAKNLPEFSVEEYLLLAEQNEGYLFPDTYFVPEDFTASDLFNLQKSTYLENIDNLRFKITDHSLSEQEIIILASIIEREANDSESMKMVSGILQNRLNIGMALQADATIEYVLDKPLNELKLGQLAAEIRNTDSLYNTYKYPGLPPTPIGNPGLGAITAVLEATSSDYFYYITDNDGNFHYAKTLAEHNSNIARYLK